MAIQQVGIHPHKGTAPIGSELAIKTSDSAPALKFRFATQSDQWLTANIWVTVDVVRKNGNESINGYANKGNAGAMEIARTSFSTPIQHNGTYIYSMPLTNALMNDVATLLGTLTYSSRSYDAIRLLVEVRCVWGSGENEYEKAAQTCYIGFKPDYTATGAYYDPQGLAITYTATGWNRPNDRWENNAIACAAKSLVSAKAVWGTVGGAGKLVIPADKLKFVPESGQTLAGSIRMCGSWQDEGTTLGTLSLSGVQVTNLTQIKTPTISAVAQTDGSVKVTVNNGTGTGTAASYIRVSMVGSTYSLDRAVLAPGETYYFRAVPAGVQTTWQAVGCAEVGGVEYASEPASATADAVSISGMEITAADGSSIAIPYNATMNSASKPETELVKLAGRDRPTVGFGEGGNVTWTISGTIITESMPGGGLETTDPAVIRALPMAGICMIRDANGNRAQVYVSNASVSRAVGGNGMRNVSITAEEVA